MTDITEPVPESIKQHLGVGKPRPLMFVQGRKAGRTQVEQAMARVPIPARPLSYQARARRTDPETSHQAAASVRNITHAHKQLLSLLVTFRDGLTDEQLHREWMLAVDRVRDGSWLPITPSGCRTRRSELVRMGKVVAAEEKGRTAAGRACTIWRLADG